MSSTFGHLFRVTTFGESHGPAIGCVIDGAPPRIGLTAHDIQFYLDRRRPGQSRHTSQRREPDEIEILSGVFEDKTTGAPIALLIWNVDARPQDYDDIKDKFRPGHADYSYFQKYGIRDHRGSGRASARETAARVAAGAVARKVLGNDVNITGTMVRMGPHGIDPKRWNQMEIDNNPFFCPDQMAAQQWEVYLDGIRKEGSSIGAVVEVTVSGVPAGLGEPIFDRLDADIAKALMSIPAVKGVEIGAGFGAAELSGYENADQMRMKGGKATFLSNNAGGTLGGISTGADIVARCAFKPTSSIPQAQKTVDIWGEDAEVSTKGRHDPCVAIRGVPVAEAMMALVLADHLLRHKAQCGE
ncbi:MAG: chorismate synthase [Rhodospirillales bacterium]